MLNKQELKNYRDLRGLTQRQVAEYCNLTQAMIAMIEEGKRNITEDNYREYVKGINSAYKAKKNGTIDKPKPLKNAVKTVKSTTVKTTTRKKKAVSEDK